MKIKKIYNKSTLSIVFLSFNITLNIFAQYLPEQVSKLITQIQQEKYQFAQIPKDLNNKEYVKKKLSFMVYIDQKLRKELEILYKGKIDNYCYDLLEEIDKQNTNALKEILKIYIWPTISQFGEEADRNAWLIVQHASDLSFQLHILSILEQLIKNNQTNMHNYAYLYDRVAINDGNEQRYGTQFKIENNEVIIQPYEGTAEELNKRRIAIGLESVEQYIKNNETRFKRILNKDA